MSFKGFSKDYFRFFEELKENNNRAWFEENKPRFRASVQDPLLDFVAAMAEPLRKISKHITAIPKRSGGSVFRIYKDVRFSKDKTPYKTHGAVHFRHALGKDAHAPGFYVHLGPDEIFVGGGIWIPPSAGLLKIREAIHDQSKAWEKVITDESLIARFGGIQGDALTRPPRGFSKDAPHIEDLKRKSFFLMSPIKRTQAYQATFTDDVSSIFRDSQPLMKFLCKALDVPF